MKILLVDDDRFFRELTLKALSKAGNDVYTACDGAEALKKVRESEFDLIITDIFMPKRDGMDVIQEAKEIRPGMKILSISSSGAAGYTSILKIAEAHGSNGSLQKPFTPSQLLKKIAEINSPVRQFGS